MKLLTEYMKANAPEFDAALSAEESARRDAEVVVLTQTIESVQYYSATSLSSDVGEDLYPRVLSMMRSALANAS